LQRIEGAIEDGIRRRDMPIPLRITYRDLEHTDAIESYVCKRAEKLRNGTPILSCRVIIDAPHRHKLHGRHYVVRIEVTTPGASLVVDRTPDAAREQENLYAAIDAAFNHAVRRLHDHGARADAASRRARTGS
jgi:ribosome-associated translation inhibitor RaiA